MRPAFLFRFLRSSLFFVIAGVLNTMSDDIDAIHTHRQVDNDAASSKVSEPANEEPPQPERYWHRLFRWHEVGTSPEEKWLIRKLDIFILSYACLVSCVFMRHVWFADFVTDVFHQIRVSWRYERIKSHC